MNTASLNSTNSASSSSVGVTVGLGSQSGISLQLGANTAHGRGNGSETTYGNSQIIASDTLTTRSGGDTTLIGTQLAGNTVNMDVGGNLNIQTLQNASNYDSQQTNAGFGVSLCIPPFCYGTAVTGSVGAGKDTVNHDYVSAATQSGIAAGTGGFDITVKGNTDLQGAALTSQAGPAKNALTTGSLTFSDLDNRQTTSSSSESASFGYGGASLVSTLANNLTSNVLGNALGGAGMPADQNQTSQTQSVISPANVTITGTGDKNKDAASQASAQTLTGRDATTANGALTNSLTLQQAQELQAQQQRAKENAIAAQYIGSVMDQVIGDMGVRYQWTEGGPEKTALHGLAGLIQASVAGTSGLAGMAAGAANEALLPVMADYLAGLGYVRGSAEFNSLLVAGSTLLGTAVGAATGNAGTGASVAYTGTVNNYLKHSEATRLAALQGKKLVGQCDSACDKEIRELESIDVKRNQELASCTNVASQACGTARQNVRNAAAEYVRKNDTNLSFYYRNEQGETQSLALDTLSGVNTAIALSYLTTLKDGVIALASAARTGFNAVVMQDPIAQQTVKDAAGASWTYISDPANWPELMGAMSAENREKLAKAYESGDGTAVGTILGAQVASLPSGGGMGSIKKIDALLEAATAAKLAALKADGLAVATVKVGSKGSWEKAINGALEPKTAYVLDNGHTYVTDSTGRVNAVVGDLDLKTMDRNTYQQCVTGKCGDTGDQGGHLIAATLGGAADRINLVPQAATLNNGAWKVMENEFKAALDAGKTVSLKIEVGYPPGAGARPDQFRVTTVIGGVIQPPRIFNQ